MAAKRPSDLKQYDRVFEVLTGPNNNAGRNPGRLRRCSSRWRSPAALVNLRNRRWLSDSSATIEVHGPWPWNVACGVQLEQMLAGRTIEGQQNRCLTAPVASQSLRFHLRIRYRQSIDINNQVASQSSG